MLLVESTRSIRGCSLRSYPRLLSDDAFSVQRMPQFHVSSIIQNSFHLIQTSAVCSCNIHIAFRAPLVAPPRIIVVTSFIAFHSTIPYSPNSLMMASICSSSSRPLATSILDALCTGIAKGINLGILQVTTKVQSPSTVHSAIFVAKVQNILE